MFAYKSSYNLVLIFQLAGGFVLFASDAQEKSSFSSFYA
jgi:hypothetical protein